MECTGRSMVNALAKEGASLATVERNLDVASMVVIDVDGGW